MWLERLALKSFPAPAQQKATSLGILSASNGNRKPNQQLKMLCHSITRSIVSRRSRDCENMTRERISESNPPKKFHFDMAFTSEKHSSGFDEKKLLLDSTVCIDSEVSASRILSGNISLLENFMNGVCDCSSFS
jgi:hypothetical protein